MSNFWGGDQRYRIFLFLGNSLHATHSLDLGGFCYIFFSTFWKKKIQTVFYFFPGKVCKPLTQKKSDICKKRSKKRYFMLIFRNFSNFRGVFFFPFFPKNFYVFFFSQEKFKIHSLTQIQEPGKKKIQHWKKKITTFSLTHSIFDQKWQKLNFSREIKKYGTFGPSETKYKPMFILHKSLIVVRSEISLKLCLQTNILWHISASLTN